MRSVAPGSPRISPPLVLSGGVAVISTAAILISLARAQGVPAITVAALRMGIAALVVAPIALVRCRSELRRLAGRDLALAAAAGLLLALHFAFWIGSLDYTSVMSSVVFVSTNPIFVALASVALLRERLRAGTLIGIAVAMVGGAIVGLTDLGQGGAGSIKGDSMALLGALSASGYLLVGRQVRKRMSLMLYIGIAYLVAGIALIGTAFALGAPLAGHAWRGYLWVSLLAAGPQLLGHTSCNWALKYVSATLVTIALLAEPVGATLLAIPILSQVPSPGRLAGGAFLLAGIFLAARAEARTSGVPSVPE